MQQQHLSQLNGLKPLLNQVMLPAHAQTSSPTQGTYATNASLGLKFNREIGGFEETQFALLDMLISPANAGDEGARNYCGQGGGGAGGDSTLFVRINADMTVDLALDALNRSTSSVCGVVTTLSGNAIADADIQLGTDDYYYVRLTGMVANGTQVTGNYETVTTNSSNDSDPRVPATGNEYCTGSFYS